MASPASCEGEVDDEQVASGVVVGVPFLPAGGRVWRMGKEAQDGGNPRRGGGS